MKRRPAASNSSATISSEAGNPTSSAKNLQSAIPEHLLSRLSKGEKAEVKKKDMLKLTNKNYDMLPEVKQKREEDRKKEEFKNRMKQVKELEAKRREALRSSSKK